MEGYVAAVLFGSAAFTVPQARGSGLIQRLSVWTLYLAMGLSLSILLCAVHIQAWLTAIWSAGLLASSLGVIGRQHAKRRWRRVLAVAAMAIGFTAAATCLILWTSFGSAVIDVLEIHYRSGVGWILFGDLSLGLTGSVIGWSCLRAREPAQAGK